MDVKYCSLDHEDTQDVFDMMYRLESCAVWDEFSKGACSEKWLPLPRNSGRSDTDSNIPELNRAVSQIILNVEKLKPGQIPETAGIHFETKNTIQDS